MKFFLYVSLKVLKICEEWWSGEKRLEAYFYFYVTELLILKFAGVDWIYLAQGSCWGNSSEHFHSKRVREYPDKLITMSF
jgi:hypothetical protein